MRKESEEMHMADASPDSGPAVRPYVMESPREGTRLEVKTDPAASEQQLRATGLQRNMRALDVGCGTGEPADAPAAVAGGFNATGKQYSNLLWARENEQGWPSCAAAFERWYARIRQRYARAGQRSSDRLSERL